MTAVDTKDREIVIERVYPHPRERVFQAWGDSAKVTHWWGPKGFSTTTYEMSFRTGGVWRFTMHGPDGVDYENRIEYTEVNPPERIRYRHGGEGEHDEVQFETTATFEEVGGDTRLTLKMVFPTQAERDHVVEKYGAVDGGVQTLERLAELLGQSQ